MLQDSNGTWHLFVSEMAGRDCGLHVWGSQSQVVHATSVAIEGPYTRQSVAIPHEAHNPQAIELNGTWYIFHIGTGDSAAPVVDCNETVAHTTQTSAEASTIHRSSSPDGPFTALDTQGYQACNNPSPVLAPNGSLFVFCTWSIRHSPSGDPAGPWNAPIAVHPPRSPGANWEDPFLWIDARGYFHVLSHVWSELPYPSNPVSGHGFSKDGLIWEFSGEQPYDNGVQRLDGSVQRFATLERPKLVFSDQSRPHTPTHLINGVSSVWLSGPDPCAVCGPSSAHTHCSHCKQQPGIDWTYTLMTKLGRSDLP